MSDKSGMLSDLAGEISTTGKKIAESAWKAPADIIIDAAKQLNIPITEANRLAKKEAQPRIDYLSNELMSLQKKSSHPAQTQHTDSSEKNQLSSPARKKNKLLSFLKRPDKKDRNPSAA